MLSYTLSREEKRPLYDQLYRLLRADIESGALSEGERLPGRRALSQQLGVSRVTVETAYQQLAAEGYVHARAGSGYYVDRIDVPLPRTTPPASFAPIETDAGYPVDFVKNAADEALFPFSVWARLTRAALIDHERALLAAVPSMGVPELREAIARLLYRMKGISCAPEQIVIGAGSEYLFNMLIQFLGRDRVIAVETPGYPLTARILQKNGRTKHRIRHAAKQVANAGDRRYGAADGCIFQPVNGRKDQSLNHLKSDRCRCHALHYPFDHRTHKFCQMREPVIL